MNVSKDLLQAMRPEIVAALAPIAAKYGLEKLELGRGSYDPGGGSFSFKLEGIAAGGLSQDARRYENERKYNRSGKWPKVGDTVEWGGEALTVAGMGQGGAIYVTKGGAKGYRIKRAQWERKYGGIFDSLPEG